MCCRLRRFPFTFFSFSFLFSLVTLSSSRFQIMKFYIISDLAQLFSRVRTLCTASRWWIFLILYFFHGRNVSPECCFVLSSFRHRQLPWRASAFVCTFSASAFFLSFSSTRWRKPAVEFRVCFTHFRHSDFPFFRQPTSPSTRKWAQSARHVLHLFIYFSFSVKPFARFASRLSPFFLYVSPGASEMEILVYYVQWPRFT